MIGTTTAILGSALIGGATALAGSAAQSSAAKRSAQAVTQAADSSNATQLQIYNQQRADAEPWRQFGIGMLGQLASIYNLNWQAPQSMTGGQWQTGPTPVTGGGGYTGQGVGGGGYNTGGSSFIQNLTSQTPGTTQTGLPATPANDVAVLQGMPAGEGVNALMGAQVDQPQVQPLATGTAPTGQQTGQPGGLNTAPFFASPDYQFRLNEGNRNLTNAFANTGNLDSGAAQRALLRYGQDTASGEFNNYVNRLASFAGMGQTVNSQNNALAQGYANNVTANNMAAAQGRASAYQQQGQAWQQGLGGVAGAGMWAINNYPWGK